MNRFLHGVARAVAETFALPGPVLEIGSYQVAGQEEIADLRGFFANKSYEGVDVRPGPGVDQVADVIEAMDADTKVPFRELRVDGGASVDDLLMQFQADLLGVPVVRPAVSESFWPGSSAGRGSPDPRASRLR